MRHCPAVRGDPPSRACLLHLPPLETTCSLSCGLVNSEATTPHNLRYPPLESPSLCKRHRTATLAPGRSDRTAHC